MTTASAAFRASVLGPLRVWRGDAELRLGPARQRALLAVLVFRHGHVVSREELVNAIWGQDAPATADGSVHTYVSGLRKILEPDRPRRSAAAVLASAGAGYRLALGDGALDADEFGDLNLAAAERLAGGDADGAAALAGRALALWNGEPLIGLPGPFAVSCRQRLVDIRLGLLETRAAAGLRMGRHHELVAELTALVAQHPVHEGLRELLMIALYRSERKADALDQLRLAREAFTAELGVAPGERLARVHQQILVGGPRIAAPGTWPVAARTTNRPRPRAASFAGRGGELARLRQAVTGLAGGRGRVIWVEGVPGIGKSELLSVGLAGIDADSVRLRWGAGDELAQRFPLWAMTDCLGRPRHDDPVGGGDLPAFADELVAEVRRWCAEGPVAVVLDDLHWADEASLLVWHRLALASRELPLLVAGACRTVDGKAGLDHLRETVHRCDGIVLDLGGLSGAAAEQLLLGFGVPAGSRPRAIARLVDGNPFYLQELAEILVRDGGTGAAGNDGTRPLSPAAALANRLGSLAPTTIDVLRQATLLGPEFRAGDLAVLAALPPDELAPVLGEASAAGVLGVEGDRVVFRQQLIRQALYERIPRPVRMALHRQAAERLAASGASIDLVARQLVAMPLTVDPWTTDWVCAHGEAVAIRAPEIGVDLLRRVRAASGPADRRVPGLNVVLARVLYRLGRFPEEEVLAVLVSTRDPELAGEMHWILGSALYRRGKARQAVAALRAAVAADGISAVWRARCLALLGKCEFLGLGDREGAEATVRAATGQAETIGDAFAIGDALSDRWLFSTADRDHAAALRFADEAVLALQAEPGSACLPSLGPLYLRSLDQRSVSLQNLDRLRDAADTLAVAASAARNHRLVGLPDSAATVHFWAGRWDQALAQLHTVDGPQIVGAGAGGLRDPGRMMLRLRGVAALIAMMRNEPDTAAEQLAAADDLPLLTSSEQAVSDFLIMAEAFAAEHAGHLDAALRALAPLLDGEYMRVMPAHVWLPDVVRIATAAGNREFGARAAELAESEAQREKQPARAAAAAARCRGLMSGDPDEVLTALEHYEAVGRPVEAAWSAEDAAELLARAGRRRQARGMYTRAVAGYREFGAAWALRRARTRFEAAGGGLDGAGGLHGDYPEAG